MRRPAERFCSLTPRGHHPEWLTQFLDVLGTEVSEGEPVAAGD